MRQPYEHQAPKQVDPKGLADYLEAMSKVVFQSGISWRVIEDKWPGIREAFHHFEPLAVASIDGPEMERLATDKRVIRNRRKLEAIVDNARAALDLEEKYGSFRDYLRSHGSFEPCVADLRKRFNFIGDFGAFYFLYVVGEEVPSYVDWCASRGRDPQPAH